MWARLCFVLSLASMWLYVLAAPVPARALSGISASGDAAAAQDHPPSDGADPLTLTRGGLGAVGEALLVVAGGAICLVSVGAAARRWEGGRSPEPDSGPPS